jgi:XRE family aerobic/anaerobic benzoate catabolism transcriptional regulator
MRSDHILGEVGRRLAAARARRGLGLGELAKRANVSRRYLTMAEAGEANLSLLKLAALAGALKVPMRELCDVDVGAAPELRVALLGLRGAGKTTVGRALAHALEVPFFELDELVEERAGLRLSAIFEFHGEHVYREHQRAALEDWLATHGSGVLATGGSLVNDEEAFQRVRSSCRTVWLKAAPEEHFQRVVDQGDLRPMRGNPRAMNELRAILAAREPRYAQADRTVMTTGKTPQAIADEVVRWLTAG